MTAGKKGENKALIGLSLTIVSTFIILLGLVWNQATWQTSISETVKSLSENQAKMLKKIEEQNLLIKDNTASINEVEMILEKSISREDMILWIFELKQLNPQISVPIPDKKNN